MPERVTSSATAVAALSIASTRLGNESSVVSEVTGKKHGLPKSHSTLTLVCLELPKSYEVGGFNTLAAQMSRKWPKTARRPCSWPTTELTALSIYYLIRVGRI